VPESPCRTYNWFRRTLLFTLVRVALALLLSIAGIAKLAANTSAQSLLSPALYMATGWMEIALSLALFTRRSASACFVIAILAAVGVVLAVFFPGRSCGCLGSWAQLSRSSHLLLACSTGALAGITLVSGMTPDHGALDLDAIT
jgi:predicted membrane channel-forming protein YqfA (hemolysin III family)